MLCFGYCSYNPNYILEPSTIEYNGETWYYYSIQYGGANGEEFSSWNNSKYIGKVNSLEEAALYILNDFFEDN